MGLKKFRRKLYAPDLELADGKIGTAEIAASAVTTAKIADDAVTNAKLHTAAVKSLKFQYDFADLGGATGAITLTDDADVAQTIPDNAVITEAYLESVTTATSWGAATIKLGITGDDDCFIAATAFDNGEFTATAISELTAGIPIRTAAAVSVLATVATAALTAGKFNVWVKYFEGD